MFADPVHAHYCSQSTIHRVELTVKSILAEPWTADRLRPFFAGRAVFDWFNPTAPAITAGELNPAALDADRALQVMVEQPILIRRPLIVHDGQTSCGFDAPVLHRLGLSSPSESLEVCQEVPGSCDRVDL